MVSSCLGWQLRRDYGGLLEDGRNWARGHSPLSVVVLRRRDCGPSRASTCRSLPVRHQPGALSEEAQAIVRQGDPIRETHYLGCGQSWGELSGSMCGPRALVSHDEVGWNLKGQDIGQWISCRKGRMFTTS